jgi:hypothetical protein
VPRPNSPYAAAARGLIRCGQRPGGRSWSHVGPPPSPTKTKPLCLFVCVFLCWCNLSLCSSLSVGVFACRLGGRPAPARADDPLRSPQKRCGRSCRWPLLLPALLAVLLCAPEPPHHPSEGRKPLCVASSPPAPLPLAHRWRRFIEILQVQRPARRHKPLKRPSWNANKLFAPASPTQFKSSALRRRRWRPHRTCQSGGRSAGTPATRASGIEHRLPPPPQLHILHANNL